VAGATLVVILVLVVMTHLLILTLASYRYSDYDMSLLDCQWLRRTRVTHTYDWSRLTDESRFERARATTADELSASLTRLAEVAERG
jgi:hypothetical protein